MTAKIKLDNIDDIRFVVSKKKVKAGLTGIYDWMCVLYQNEFDRELTQKEIAESIDELLHDVWHVIDK
jgi:hypothetical protein